MRETLSNTFRRELNSIMSEISIVVESVDYFAVNLTLLECVTETFRPSSMTDESFSSYSGAFNETNLLKTSFTSN